MWDVVGDAPDVEGCCWGVGLEGRGGRRGYWMIRGEGGVERGGDCSCTYVVEGLPVGALE